MPFEKGQSGNPGGRPAATTDDGRSISELAREYTQRAIDALVRVVDNLEADPRATVMAAQALLDRGWGRPKQSLDVTSDGQRLSLVDELEAARRRALQSLGGSNGGGGEE